MRSEKECVCKVPFIEWEVKGFGSFGRVPFQNWSQSNKSYLVLKILNSMTVSYLYFSIDRIIIEVKHRQGILN